MLIWGCGGGFGALRLRGWAGGAGAGQCCEFGPNWPMSICNGFEDSKFLENGRYARPTSDRNLAGAIAEK